MSSPQTRATRKWQIANSEQWNTYMRNYAKKRWHNDPEWKERQTQSHRSWKQRNSEKVKARAKKYLEENREEILKRRKEYYKNNKEIIRERGKAYREANKENIALRARQRWYAKKGMEVPKKRTATAIQIYNTLLIKPSIDFVIKELGLPRSEPWRNKIKEVMSVYPNLKSDHTLKMQQKAKERKKQHHKASYVKKKNFTATQEEMIFALNNSRTLHGACVYLGWPATPKWKEKLNRLQQKIIDNPSELNNKY